MPRPTCFALLAGACLLAGGCGHHAIHHVYHEQHQHNSYNTPDHPDRLHDQDSHRDVAHEHEHFGGND